MTADANFEFEQQQDQRGVLPGNEHNQLIVANQSV